MPQPRSSQISLSDTPYYHCICSCVRRSFLCGVDTYSYTRHALPRKLVVMPLLLFASLFSTYIRACALSLSHVHNLFPFVF